MSLSLAVELYRTAVGIGSRMSVKKSPEEGALLTYKAVFLQ